MLGNKLDNIPFSRYHLMIIAVLSLDARHDRLAVGAGQGAAAYGA
jgi:hypothetical protein